VVWHKAFQSVIACLALSKKQKTTKQSKAENVGRKWYRNGAELVLLLGWLWAPLSKVFPLFYGSKVHYLLFSLVIIFIVFYYTLLVNLSSLSKLAHFSL
jgi:membrane protein YqaA with SNARE-associated domain